MIHKENLEENVSVIIESEYRSDGELEVDQIPPDLNHPYITLSVEITKNSYENISPFVCKLDDVNFYNQVDHFDFSLFRNVPRRIVLNDAEPANIVNRYVLSHPDVEVKTNLEDFNHLLKLAFMF